MEPHGNVGSVRSYCHIYASSCYDLYLVDLLLLILLTAGLVTTLTGWQAEDLTVFTTVVVFCASLDLTNTVVLIVHVFLPVELLSRLSLSLYKISHFWRNVPVHQELHPSSSNHS